MRIVACARSKPIRPRALRVAVCAVLPQRVRGLRRRLLVREAATQHPAPYRHDFRRARARHRPRQPRPRGARRQRRISRHEGLGSGPPEQSQIGEQDLVVIRGFLENPRHQLQAVRDAVVREIEVGCAHQHWREPGSEGQRACEGRLGRGSISGRGEVFGVGGPRVRIGRVLHDERGQRPGCGPARVDAGVHLFVPAPAAHAHRVIGGRRSQIHRDRKPGDTEGQRRKQQTNDHARVSSNRGLAATPASQASARALAGM